jgi:pilus assembly protein CpaB
MARMRVFIVLVLAIAAGGVFAFGTYNYVQKLPGRTTTIPTKQVAVAATDLEVGAELTRDDVRIIDWPANAVPSKAIGNPKDVIGRGLIMPMIRTNRSSK